MVPGLGVEPRRAGGPRDFKATGKRQRTKDLANSLPFPVSEESEEYCKVRGLWIPRWTPVSSHRAHGLGERENMMVPWLPLAAVLVERNRRIHPRIDRL